MSTFKHILVPLDWGEPSQRALDIAIDLARAFGAALDVVHVYEIPVYAYGDYIPAGDLITPIEQAAREKLNKEITSIRQRMPDANATLRRGVPWREIVAVIEETHADLVVMGTHGRRGVSHFLLGSVAEKVVRMSPVPVLTIRS